MAEKAYLKISGITDGANTADSVGPGVDSNADWIGKNTDIVPVVAFEGGVARSFAVDGSVGTAGIRGPVRLTKYFDNASPKIFDYLAKNKQVDVEIHFYRTQKGAASAEMFATHVYKNATFTTFKTVLPNVLDAATASTPSVLEVVEFTYEKLNVKKGAEYSFPSA